MSPSVLRTNLAADACQPSGRPRGTETAQPDERATSRAVDSTSTGGCDTELTRGTMKKNTTRMPPTARSDRTRLEVDPAL
jgi:hypothetical protein